MLIKKEGKKLELDAKDKSKIHGGWIDIDTTFCGQDCADSCPLNDWTRFSNYRDSWKAWRLTPWPSDL